MPFDPTLVVIFGTLFLSFLASLVYAFWYQQFKHKHKISRGDAAEDPSRSLRVSELEALIDGAVTEAMQPLHARLATLEADVRSLQAAVDPGEPLPERTAQPLLDLPDDADAPEMTGLPSRKRIR